MERDVMPQGAVRAVVIDVRGAETDAVVEGGRWFSEAVTEERIVRFENANGALVPQPLPQGHRRAIEDAAEPCPVCSAVQWVEVAEAIGCERCGWMACGAPSTEGETAGILLDPLGGEADEPTTSADRDRERRRLRQAARAAAGFPVYARVGKPVRISGSSGPSPEVRTGFHVDQREVPGERVSVETTVSPGSGWTLRERLAHLLEDDGWTEDRSQAAQQIQWLHAERTARQQAANTPIETRELVIDGERRPFAFVAAPDGWIAVREHGDVQVVVTAREGTQPQHVALSPIADLEHPERGTLADLEVIRRNASSELPTRAEVSAWIDEAGFSAHRDEILASIAPAYRLRPADGEAPHRIGGLPDLAPGEAWPHCDGVPHTLVLQLDCSKLPPLTSEFGDAPPWNHRGELLRVFAGLDMAMPEPDRAVVLARSPAAPLTRADLPPRPEPLPDWAWEAEDESLRMLAPRFVHVVPCLTVGFDPYGRRFSHSEIQACEWLLHRISAGPIAAQLLGAATTMQGEDPRHTGPFVLEEHGETENVPDSADWTVLANLADHPEMSFGDGGALALVIPLADLAEGRYHRVVTDPSMG
ncbi:YwqG family protein [Solirubrobacter phytolaccae]|uniref:YwqG family protein n=1 Tax=Solirubrobacter phytolaccae TaxID=1404360 RepID=A0A9X3NNR3_9ACTN|nr:DUF1963 domain-containing protein [Solirubrobacter phytolaccae]MDA0184812.1 YwqG family protein [Solirubrobacter phytolaccae]